MPLQRFFIFCCSRPCPFLSSPRRRRRPSPSPPPPPPPHPHPHPLFSQRSPKKLQCVIGSIRQQQLTSAVPLSELTNYLLLDIFADSRKLYLVMELSQGECESKRMRDYVSECVSDWVSEGFSG